MSRPTSPREEVYRAECGKCGFYLPGPKAELEKRMRSQGWGNSPSLGAICPRCYGTEEEGAAPAAPDPDQLPLFTETCMCTCGCTRWRHPADLYCRRCFESNRYGWKCDSINPPQGQRRRRFRKGSR